MDGVVSMVGAAVVGSMTLRADPLLSTAVHAQNGEPLVLQSTVDPVMMIIKRFGTR